MDSLVSCTEEITGGEWVGGGGGGGAGTAFTVSLGFASMAGSGRRGAGELDWGAGITFL